MKVKAEQSRLDIGTVLVHSIGNGHDSFFQVIKKTEKSVVVQRIEEKWINRNLRCQTADVVPIKDKFRESEKPLTLRIHPDGRIGPERRLIWWSMWNGEPQSQYSS